jgi:hypothetical protein
MSALDLGVGVVFPGVQRLIAREGAYSQRAANGDQYGGLRSHPPGLTAFAVSFQLGATQERQSDCWKHGDRGHE